MDIDRPASAEAAPPRRGMMNWRSAKHVRMAPADARRQGEITTLAFLVLGRDEAIAFLNTAHAGLGGRPIDLATASDTGRDRVEAEIGRMAYAPPRAVP